MLDEEGYTARSSFNWDVPLRAAPDIVHQRLRFYDSVGWGKMLLLLRRHFKVGWDQFGEPRTLEAQREMSARLRHPFPETPEMFSRLQN